MVKYIGILGGMSPESTVTYYQHITRSYQDRFEDYGFPRIIIVSVSFQKYVDWMTAGNWEAIANGLITGVETLARGGADFGIIAANTMHKVFDQVREKSPLPLISIIDATAEKIKEKGLKKVGLLGTRFTMSEPFFKAGLDASGIKTIVPDPGDQEIINNIAFQELGKNIIKNESKQRIVAISQKLKDRGAQGIVLGCTELPMLIGNSDCDIPLLNTTTIHADNALAFALEE